MLSKAKEGVRISIVVWRHELLSVFDRYIYLGEVSIEREVEKLKTKAGKLGLRVEVFHEKMIVNDVRYSQLKSISTLTWTVIASSDFRQPLESNC